ncbi:MULTISPECIES: START domain-containing protein [Myxococcaceae]|uniref:START domain-containing protein n=1 Tax=Myxococcaceae TaxID=31 RepID=UPI00188F083C|nr:MULTISPECIES: START domain-containing protein [Myxococcaceae]MBF5041316.1 SRPBCC family protein [Simulacricoccus sp. 17bor-14]
MISAASVSLVVLLALGAGPASPPAAWEAVTEVDGIRVYARERAESSVSEVRAVGMVDAPPLAVWQVVRDYANQPKSSPYVEVARVLASEADGKVILLYNVIKAPLADRRDVTVRITDESDWQEGRGYLKARWTASELGPPPTPGIVRIHLNDGFWLLEPMDGGARTRVTYSLYTDPGGSVPRWIVNRANRSSLPEVLRALRREVAARAAGAASER